MALVHRHHAGDRAALIHMPIKEAPRLKPALAT